MTPSFAVLITLVTGGIILLLAAGVSRAVRLTAHRQVLAGQVVVITGASRGIGEALAHAFATHQANLVLAARNVDQLECVAEACRGLCPQADILSIPTDVTNDDARRSLVSQAIDHFGYIDILVNNAGIRQGGPFVGVGGDSFRHQVEVNLLAPMYLTRLVLPGMLARGRGTIINMASAAGRHAEPYFVAYGTSKHGLIGFGEGLRRELTMTGVRIMTVTPGFTDTAMVDQIGPVYRKIGLPAVPSERVARKTIDGLLLGAREVKVGWLEALGGLAAVLVPALADLYWKLLMPDEFPEKASRQHSD